MTKSDLFCLIAALSLLAACENTIRYDYDSTDGQITLLSRMLTSETEHRILLSMSYPDRVDSLPGATVTCYVNGDRHVARQQPVPLEEYIHYDPLTYEMHSEMRPRRQLYTEYRFSARIQPGDEVRVEAVKGDLKAWAQVSVPQPARLVQVDTATVRHTVSYMDIDGSYSSDYRYMDFSARIRDVSGVDSYFTLSGSYRAEGEILSFDSNGDLVQTEAFLSTDENVRYETFHDRILEDGYSAGEGSLLSEFLATNAMHCFSDKEFRDGEATVHPSFDADLFDSGQEGSLYWRVHPGSKGRFRTVFSLLLRTIDRDYYNYLRAINNLETYGYDVSPIIEPTMLPCNVIGGFGMVSVAAEERFTLGPEEVIIDRSGESAIYY